MSILRLEEAGLNAWPALRVAHLQGWVLRFANGFTKRANSANPLYGDGRDLDARVDAVERWYAAAGQRTIFRLTALAPDGLDAILDARGYRRIDETIVETASVATLDATVADGFVAGTDAAEWVAVAGPLQHDAPETRPTVTAMLERMAVLPCFGLIRRDGIAVACGLAVAEGDLVGIFEVEVDRSRRRAGLGRAMTESLLAWGRDRGARTAYLQVTATNAPAIALYDRLGFRESHRYWYRVAPPTT
ncbi:MAG: GNAT family N-acetyltransferase [Alphaproteobacteria bacterium]